MLNAAILRLFAIKIIKRVKAFAFLNVKVAAQEGDDQSWHAGNKKYKFTKLLQKH